MIDAVEKRFRDLAPAVGFCSLRLVYERSEQIHVRQNILQPVQTGIELGAMISSIHEGGMGYAATTDLTDSGLKRALQQAMAWAEHTKGKTVVDYRKVENQAPVGEYRSSALRPWDSVPLSDKLDLLMGESARLKVGDSIVDWDAFLAFSVVEQLYLTNTGGRVFQAFQYLVPGLSVTANRGAETVSRHFGGFDLGRQGGLEVLDQVNFRDQAPKLVSEVLELLEAPNCPTGTMDVLLDADQMYLQIHESIGHPLELDRILGDERNYAGTSFVTPGMFGSYRYGSDLLNVTFDPTNSSEFASYAYDDEGNRAQREVIIEKGILRRGLGGLTSQTRSGLPGVANSRACSWNRPPIDRMANLNLEPGTSTLDQLIASIEEGIYMKRNCSWSIDDSRNKFQFGCEYGRLIQNGTLGAVVKKPCYKGISATFWRNLRAVGDQSTFHVLGTPNCGKGEPNQAIRVGHATPACVFSNVDVFGGE